MLTAAQHRKRSTGIGSSDIAAVLDLDEHREPIDVWMEKVGLSKPVRSVAMWTGQRLEGPIASMYEELVGAKLRRAGGTVRHARHRWALATLDRRAKVGPAPVVEIKNVGGWQMVDWRDGVPASKYLQVQWQLEVVDEELAHLVALLGGTDLRVFPILRDRDLGASLLEAGGYFWSEYVLKKAPPPHDEFAADRLVRARYPKNDGRILPATDEAIAVARELVEIRSAEADLKRRKAGCEARAKELIGTADGVEACFSWKLERGRVAWADVARELNPPQEIIDKHTAPPVRKLELKKEKKA